MTVELWRGSDARWRWRYVEPSANGRPLTLYGNKHYVSRDEAVRAATTAYPDVPLLEHVPSLAGRRRSRRRMLVSLVVALLLLAGWRRARRRPRIQPPPSSSSGRQSVGPR
jgi:hypothetical protein